MKLGIHDAFVQAVGDFDEMRTLRQILTVKNPRHWAGEGKTNQKEPEYVEFLEEESDCFLRGLLPWVHEELVGKGIIPEYIVDSDDFDPRPFVRCPVDILPGLTPRDYQLHAAEMAFNHRRGIVQAATGAGKTVVIALVNAMVERFEGGNTLTMVNKKHLLYQSVEKFRQYGLKDVGIIGDGVYEPGMHTVAMVQSLNRSMRQGDTTFKRVYAVNWDETHHAGANSWMTVAYNVASKLSIGYSGTPFRTGYVNNVDPADMQMQGITGSVLVRITASELIERGLLAKPFIYMVPVDPAHCRESRSKEQRKKAREAKSWAQVEDAWISNNPHRNDLITRLAVNLVGYNQPPLVLVRKIAHGKELLRLFVAAGLKPIFLSGGPKRHLFDPTCEDDVRSEASDDADADVQQYLSGEYNVLIGSTVFDEGVDLPAVSAVINCAGGKAFVSNLQRVGRGLRPKAGDNRAFIFDFIDHGHDWVERHSYERIQDYHTEPAYEVFMGYTPTVTLFGRDW